MNSDFTELAKQFVVENRCASNMPVELVKKAMERGAQHMVDQMINRVRVAKEEIAEHRRANLGK